MSKHTPGPWEIESTGITQNGYTIAKIKPLNSLMPAIGYAYGEKADEVMINAHLMAISPVMFEAIRSCQNALSEWIVPDSGIKADDLINTLLGVLDDQALVRMLKALE